MPQAVTHPLLFSDWLELSEYIKDSVNREASSVHDMGVPRHLQVPLSIDTNITYDLDRSMFPGLDDPRYKHERVLCIASDYVQNFGRVSETKCTPTQPTMNRRVNTRIHRQSVEPSREYKCELLEDLMGMIDISTEDLLLGLKNTEDYLSLVNDVIQGLPHSDELRYLEGPVTYSPESNFSMQHVNIHYSAKQPVTKCISGVSKGFQGLHSVSCIGDCTDTSNRAINQESCLKRSSTLNKCISKDHCVSNSRAQPQSDCHQSRCVNNPLYTKRKRIPDPFNSSFQKRQCNGDGQMPYQTCWGNYSNGYPGATYGHQVRVV